MPIAHLLIGSCTDRSILSTLVQDCRAHTACEHTRAFVEKRPNAWTSIAIIYKITDFVTVATAILARVLVTHCAECLDNYDNIHEATKV